VINRMIRRRYEEFSDQAFGGVGPGDGVGALLEVAFTAGFQAGAAEAAAGMILFRDSTAGATEAALARNNAILDALSDDASDTVTAPPSIFRPDEHE